MQSLPAVWRNGLPVPPSAIAADVPRELDQLTLSLLSLDAMSRPHSAAEVSRKLIRRDVP